MEVSPKRLFSALLVLMGYGVKGGLFLLSLVFPRTADIWVFGAKGGEAFVDNSKYLYLYTAAERKHIRAVWLSRNNDVIAELQEQGYEAYHADSPQGIWLNLRAEHVFISHAMPDVNRWCSGGATTVVLWHGIALKRIGWDYGNEQSRIISNITYYLRYNIFDRYSWLVVPSSAMIRPFVSAFRMTAGRILVTGYPRNDFLLGNISGYNSYSDQEVYEHCQKLHQNNRVLVYTPTKHLETNQKVAEQFRLAEFDQWLGERDAYLFIKSHPNDPFEYNGEDFSRIVEVPEKMDIYPLLKHTDMLITDYSSIYFDYLLLNKPIVFYPFDLEEYRSTRGFYLDYEGVTPGPIATNFEELLENIEDTLKTDEYAEERESVRETFLQPTTVNRCEAICDRFDPRVEQPIRS